MDGITKSRPHARAPYAPIVLVASSLLALAGCGAVYTTEPIGRTPVAVDPLAWNGYWTTPDNVASCGHGADAGETGCLIVTVVDQVQGVLAVAPEGRAVEPARAYVRVADRPDAVFVSLEDWDSGEAVRPLVFLRGAVRSTGRSEVSLVLWEPVASRFCDLAEAGLLPSASPVSCRSGNVPTLGPLEEPELELLTRTMKWELFDWEEPIVYVRVIDSSQLPPPTR